MLDSTFAHNFFGVYTYEARDIVFRGNVFRDNILYGFDPHDATAGLVVEDNEAYGNGSHGFIVSRYVVDSVFRGNRSHDNLGNGIVMDFASDRNLIEANVVEDNAKDGIVLLDRPATSWSTTSSEATAWECVSTTSRAGATRCEETCSRATRSGFRPTAAPATS
ncbi:hypothetical protein BH20ACT1_BH20ACT1_08560 [soil metagenome]